MNEQKFLLITFDYELFLGRQSGSVRDCLIDPTDKILTTLDKYGFKALFFVDTVYLLRLKALSETNSSARSDFDAITEQLVRLVKSGHEIHIHIHPHWMDAVYDSPSNQWSLTEKRYYSFASITEEQRIRLFDQSVAIIQTVLDKAESAQALDCYRAGGWSIQPFENFKPRFLQHGIKHEWSVMPGKYQVSDAHSYDFRKASFEETVYPFDQDPSVKKKEGPFREWTISSITLNPYEKWIDFKISGLLRRLGKGQEEKGQTVSSNIKSEGDIYCRENYRRIMASFEGLNPFRIRKYLSAIRKSDYFHFISHPKLITSFEMDMTDKLFRALKNRFQLQTDFRKTLTD